MKNKTWIKLKEDRPAQNTKVWITTLDNKELQAILRYDIKENRLFWMLKEGNLEYDKVKAWSSINSSYMQDVYDYVE